MPDSMLITGPMSNDDVAALLKVVRNIEQRTNAHYNVMIHDGRNTEQEAQAALRKVFPAGPDQAEPEIAGATWPEIVQAIRRAKQERTSDCDLGLSAEEAKQYIVRVVADLQGVKATELAARTAVALLRHDVAELVGEVVEAGELVEVEYVLPALEHRAKSFLLPKGTKVRLL